MPAPLICISKRVFAATSSGARRVAAAPVVSGPKAFLMRIGEFAKRNPIPFAICCSTMKCLVGDYAAQVAEGGQYNPYRGLVFGAYGVFYVGIWQYFLYNHIYAMMFAAGKGNPLPKTLTEIFGHMPWMYMPAFYSFHTVGEMISHGTLDKINPENVIPIAKEKWKTNMWGDFKLNAGFWGPVSGIMFKFIPDHLRIPWLSACGTFYYAILSWNRGALSEDEHDVEAIKEQASENIGDYTSTVQDLSDTISDLIIKDDMTSTAGAPVQVLDLANQTTVKV